jgi:trans-aconitate 2-methyltransferase
MRWDPGLYEGFADHRLRPALDLMGAIPDIAAASIHDLGCGPGAATRLLARRWPAAAVTGVDSSAEMIARANAEPGTIRWQQADIAAWRPEAPADLIFSNATLHWLDDHAGLFPRLFASVTPGGVLAVQMPRNHAAPTHTAIADLAAEPRWAERLGRLLRPNPVAPPEAYYDLLAPAAEAVDVWETEYLHVLEGEDPVVRWVSATALAPLLQALPPAEAEEFRAEYAARMRAAYPRRADGTTLMPYRRLFMVARRKR